jgi:Protein of unknown function with HXXEE motif
MNVTLSTLAWLSMIAYSVHILEEFSLDWRNWARGVLKLPVEWADFYVTNGIVLALGIAQAMLAPTLPIAPLAFGGLMLVNAIFFHVIPVLTTRRFSPGLMTALIIFLPLSVALFWFALANELVTSKTAIAGLMVGAVIMAYPIVMLKVRDKPFFRQAA